MASNPNVTAHFDVEVDCSALPVTKNEILLQWRVKGRGLAWEDTGISWRQQVDGYTDEQIVDASALLLAQWRKIYKANDEEQRVVKVTTIVTTIVAKRVVL